MPKRIYDDKSLARVCVRLWTDDYEYLRKVSRSQGATGWNLLVRQIVHTYVAHMKDEEERQMNKVDDDLLDIQINLDGLEFEKEGPQAEVEIPEEEGEILDITF